MRINLLNQNQLLNQTVKKAEIKNQPTATLQVLSSDTFTKSATSSAEAAVPELSLKEKILSLFSNDTLKKITGLFNKLFMDKFMKLLKTEVFDKILALFDDKLCKKIMDFLDKELFSKIKTIITETLQGNTQTANTEKATTLNIAA